MRPLRIGVDAHAIGERATGNERFLANVLRAMREISDHELVLYFTSEEAARAWPPHERTRVELLRPAHPAARLTATLPLVARRDRVDVLLVQYTGPVLPGRPVVTVVHDVAFALFPRYYTRFQRLWMPRAIPATMRAAARIVTVSGFSRSEITRVYGIPPERIVVAYDAVDPVFLRPPPASPVEPPFFLSVGNLQPRKNLGTLVAAFRRALDREPDLPHRLVLVGQEWYEAERLRHETQDLMAAGRVMFTGYVPDDALVGLMAVADAFAYPSVYEGFGLPPLEAMAVGTPAIVADIPVTREVFGDSALRVGARDVGAWAEALLRTARDDDLRADLVRRGRDAVTRFRWEDSAAVVLRALEGAAT